MQSDQIQSTQDQISPSQSKVKDVSEDEFTRLDVAAANLKADLARLRGRNRILPLMLIAAFAVFTIAANALGLHLPLVPTPSGLREWFYVASSSRPFAIALGFIVVAAFAYRIWFTTQETSLRAEIELLETKRQIAEELAVPAEPAPLGGPPGAPEAPPCRESMIFWESERLVREPGLMVSIRQW